MNTRSLIAVAALVAFTIPKAISQEGSVFHWVNPEGSQYYKSSSWSPLVPFGSPQAIDDIIFDLNANYTVSWDFADDPQNRRTSSKSMEVSRGDVKFSGYWSLSRHDVVGRADIRSSNLWVGGGFVRFELGVGGELTIHGPSAFGARPGSVTVGSNGYLETNLLKVNQGALFSIQDGGFAQVTGGAQLLGHTEITGSTSKLDLGLDTARLGGLGILREGATITGRTNEVVGQIQILDGLWDVERDLLLHSSGTVYVDDLGIIRSHTTIIGSASDPGRFPFARAENYGQWTTSHLVVGGESNGTLIIGREGSVTTGTLEIGNTAGYSGTVRIRDNGTLTVSLLSVGGSATQAGGTGLLEIDGGSVRANSLKVWADGQVILSSGSIRVGLLDVRESSAIDLSSSTLAFEQALGNLSMANGILSPGESPGLASVDGDLTMFEGATFLAELQGYGRGLLDGYDAINVTGDFFSTGTVDVDLLAGFNPQFGDTFQLVAASNYFGSPIFNFDDAILMNGLAWDTTSFLNNGSIRVIQAVPEPIGGVAAALFLIALSFRQRHRRME